MFLPSRAHILEYPSHMSWTCDAAGPAWNEDPYNKTAMSHEKTSVPCEGREATKVTNFASRGIETPLASSSKYGKNTLTTKRVIVAVHE